MTVQELTTIFGKNIRKYRKSHKWSQELLAEKMDVSVNTISEIETGKKFVRAERLICFAAILETNVYELFKPDGVLPDKSEDILQEFGREIRQKVENLENAYIMKLKGQAK